MAMARRSQQRQLAVNIANCVAATFGGKKIEWTKFVNTGEVIVWDKYPLPPHPQLQSEIERLTKHEEQLHGAH